MFKYLINTLPHNFINFLTSKLGIGCTIVWLIIGIIVVVLIISHVVNKYAIKKIAHLKKIPGSSYCLILVDILFLIICPLVILSTLDFTVSWVTVTNPVTYDSDIAVKRSTNISKYAIVNDNNDSIKLSKISNSDIRDNSKGPYFYNGTWNTMWLTDSHSHTTKIKEENKNTMVKVQATPQSSKRPTIKLITITPRRKYQDLKHLDTQYEVIINKPIATHNVK